MPGPGASGQPGLDAAEMHALADNGEAEILATLASSLFPWAPGGTLMFAFAAPTMVNDNYKPTWALGAAQK